MSVVPVRVVKKETKKGDEVKVQVTNEFANIWSLNGAIRSGSFLPKCVAFFPKNDDGSKQERAVINFSGASGDEEFGKVVVGYISDDISKGTPRYTPRGEKKGETKILRKRFFTIPEGTLDAAQIRRTKDTVQMVEEMNTLLKPFLLKAAKALYPTFSNFSMQEVKDEIEFKIGRFEEVLYSNGEEKTVVTEEDCSFLKAAGKPEIELIAWIMPDQKDPSVINYGIKHGLLKSRYLTDLELAHKEISTEKKIASSASTFNVAPKQVSKKTKREEVPASDSEADETPKEKKPRAPKKPKVTLAPVDESAAEDE